MASQSNVLLLLLLGVMAVAVSAGQMYTAGGAKGWDVGINYGTMDVDLGDSVEFNFLKGAHNLVKVDLNGYQSCYDNPSDKNPVWTSGTVITFNEAVASYYICTFAGHCDAGMKVIVNVRKP
ncbi:unnamed protein product [Calypogeia fissa]